MIAFVRFSVTIPTDENNEKRFDSLYNGTALFPVGGWTHPLLGGKYPYKVFHAVVAHCLAYLDVYKRQVYVLFIRRYLMETGEDGTRVYVDRWPAWLNLEDRVYRPLVLTVLPFLGAVLARCVNGICEGPLPLFMKRPEKNQVVAPGESSRFFRQAQDVRLLHMIYSSMGYGFMMLGAGLILMTAYVLFL